MLARLGIQTEDARGFYAARQQDSVRMFQQFRDLLRGGAAQATIFADLLLPDPLPIAPNEIGSPDHTYAIELESLCTVSKATWHRTQASLPPREKVRILLKLQRE